MRPFEEEFKLLNEALREMGALVASAVHNSVFSLVEKNEDYAHHVLRDEALIDRMEIQIDDLASSLIVREQPMARDMRLVVATIKINTDLERMGDLAVNVVERSLSLMKQPDLPEWIDISGIANLVQSMVLESLDAFVKRDAAIARAVLTADKAVDNARNIIHQQVINLMQRDSSCIARALDFLIIARSLERIGDHATNIAENVIFLVQGIDIRHRALDQVA
jgi:phosphate transport system protein